jgi:hypothetical protein
MSNKEEPKASEFFWDKYKWPFAKGNHFLHLENKEDFIQLVSLEAKIELLNGMFIKQLPEIWQDGQTPIKLYADIINPKIKEIKSELDQLKEKHGLK